MYCKFKEKGLKTQLAIPSWHQRHKFLDTQTKLYSCWRLTPTIRYLVESFVPQIAFVGELLVELCGILASHRMRGIGIDLKVALAGCGWHRFSWNLMMNLCRCNRCARCSLQIVVQLPVHDLNIWSNFHLWSRISSIELCFYLNANLNFLRTLLYQIMMYL